MKLNIKALSNLNLKEQLILAVITLFITGCLFYGIIIPPALYHYRIAKKQFSVQQRLLKVRKEKIETLSLMKDSFEDFKMEMADKKSSFFTRNEVHGFLKGLDARAKDTGNTLVSIKPVSSDMICASDCCKEDMCYQVNVVEVKVKGRYNNILKLFKKFDGYGKVLGINQLDFKMLKDTQPQLSAKFNLNLYSLDKK